MRRLRFSIYVFLTLVFVVLFLLVLFLRQGIEEAPATESEPLFSAEEVKEQVSTGEAVATLSSPASSYMSIYTGLLEVFIPLVKDKKDPREILQLVRSYVESDPILAKACHALVHKIGHEVYEHYGSFAEAVSFQDEVCNSGYIHGILESHFDSIEDPLAEMHTICEVSDIDKGRCYHGVGHSLMYIEDNNLPRALELCDSYSNAFASEQCVQGVFMEHFLSGLDGRPSDFIDESDPFYPCADQGEGHKYSCYFYAPTLFLRVNDYNYIDALNWCEEAEPNFVSLCVKGVGSLAMKYDISNPKKIEAICEGTDHKNICIDGMVGLYINHYDSPARGRKMCDQLEPSNQAACNGAIDSREHLFDSDYFFKN